MNDSIYLTSLILESLQDYEIVNFHKTIESPTLHGQMEEPSHYSSSLHEGLWIVNIQS